MRLITTVLWLCAYFHGSNLEQFNASIQTNCWRFLFYCIGNDLPQSWDSLWISLHFFSSFEIPMCMHFDFQQLFSSYCSVQVNVKLIDDHWLWTGEQNSGEQRSFLKPGKEHFAIKPSMPFKCYLFNGVIVL